MTRPLSPHLTVYHFSLIMILSILHRLTGLASSFFLLAWTVFWVCHLFGWGWVIAWVVPLCLTPLGKVLTWTLVWATFYHALDGVRHWVWALGKGLDLKTAHFSGVLVLVGSFLLTAGLFMALRWGGA